MSNASNTCAFDRLSFLDCATRLVCELSELTQGR